jgi:hypothetical protein
VSALHITNGDCAAATLREFIRDPVVITADPLFEGPAPRLEGDAWLDTRAGYLASATSGTTYDQTRRDLGDPDRAIAGAGERDEVVLWFEHDLFDQLLLIRTLALLRHQKIPATLICIDRFPGVERFLGLGQLTAIQLATLVDTRREVTGDQYELATTAWAAFREADPTALVEMVRQRNPDTADALPFVRAALKRFLAEYPSTRNGLSHTDQLALDALEDGPLTGGALFRQTQASEERPFLGDFSFYDGLRRLASAAVPLVTINGPGTGLDLIHDHLAITDAGHDVCAGRRDAVALNGIDQWRGGVHLIGDHHSPWRWDTSRETLVS